jgi:succinate dehydrogenase / fumarate reductase membrane anchor subunit
MGSGVVLYGETFIQGTGYRVQRSGEFPEMNSTIAGHPKPSGGIELYAWLFMRISGLALIFLALGHLIIMHMIHTVDYIDYQFVAGRYAKLFWRGYDLAMLLLALLHGCNGLRYLIDDYTHQGKWRTIWIRVLYTTTIVFAVLGTWVIVAFQLKG